MCLPAPLPPPPPLPVPLPAPRSLPRAPCTLSPLPLAPSPCHVSLPRPAASASPSHLSLPAAHPLEHCEPQSPPSRCACLPPNTCLPLPPFLFCTSSWALAEPLSTTFVTFIGLSLGLQVFPPPSHPYLRHTLLSTVSPRPSCWAASSRGSTKSEASWGSVMC